MKLNWTLQHGCLVADVFASTARTTKYIVEQDEKGWGARACHSFGGRGRIDYSPTRQPLDEMIRWCEIHAECPSQPVAAQSGTSTATGGMPASASKFPGTMDAEVWASRCTAWFGAFKVPDLAEWFQAALSHGFREGQASVYELVDKAQRERDCFGPEPKPGWQASFDARDWAKEFMRRNRENLFGGDPSKYAIAGEETMVTWFADALMRGYDEHRWKAEREVASGGKSERADKVPGTRAPEPPGVEERLAALEARQKAVGKFWEGERRSDMDFVLGRLEKLEALEARMQGLDGPGLKRRMDELEAERQSDRDAVSAIQIGTEKRLGDLEARHRELLWRVKENAKRYENVDDAVGNLESRIEALEARPPPPLYRADVSWLRESCKSASGRLDVLEARLDGGPA